jgi:hypothetical protein
MVTDRLTSERTASVLSISKTFFFWTHFRTFSHYRSFWKGKQDRQCTYNATLKRVRESMLQWKSNKYCLLVCVCVRVRLYPGAWACAWAYVHVALSSMQRVCAILWRHLCPFSVRHIFQHYLINGAIFGKKLRNIKCVFWYSVQLLSTTFLILRRI